MAAKINMRLDKNEMPSQDPNVRNKNFLEVALGYTEEGHLQEVFVADIGVLGGHFVLVQTHIDLSSHLTLPPA